MSHKSSKNILILKRVGDINILVIKPETVNAAYKLSGGVLYKLQRTLSNVNVTVTDAHSVRMLHILCNYRGLDYFITIKSYTEYASLSYKLGTTGPTLIITYIKVAVRTEGNTHRARKSCFLVNGYVKPLGYIFVLVDLKNTTRESLIGIVGTSKYKIALGVDSHSVGCCHIIGQDCKKL